MLSSLALLVSAADIIKPEEWNLLAQDIGAVARRCQPVHIPGAGGQFSVGQGGISIDVEEKQNNTTCWVAGGN